MAETLMLNRGGGGGMEGGRWKLQQVEGTGAVTPGDLSPRRKSLQKTVKRVQFHRPISVGSKLAYINEILNKVRGNNNIIKMKVVR